MRPFLFADFDLCEKHRTWVGKKTRTLLSVHSYKNLVLFQILNDYCRRVHSSGVISMMLIYAHCSVLSIESSFRMNF